MEGSGLLRLAVLIGGNIFSFGIDKAVGLCYNLRTVLKLEGFLEGMKKAQYQTAGRRALLSFLSAHPDRQFSADELYGAVTETAVMGKSSVYRQLSLLCEEETVRRFRNDSRGCNVYQYVGSGCDCREHFHEKCTECGRVVHLDCHATAEFVAHLSGEHGFLVDCGRTILYGICAECREKGGERNG